MYRLAIQTKTFGTISVVQANMQMIKQYSFNCTFWCFALIGLEIGVQELLVACLHTVSINIKVLSDCCTCFSTDLWIKRRGKQLAFFYLQMEACLLDNNQLNGSLPSSWSSMAQVNGIFCVWQCTTCKALAWPYIGLAL